MEIKVTVIIPNWNGRLLLKDCLSSILHQSYKKYEVLLVDNGSTDGSLEYVSKYFKKVKIVRLNKNYGFSAAINRGVESCASRYVLFLNNDTKVHKEFIGNLVKALRGKVKIAAVGGKMLSFFNRKLIDGVGICLNEVGQAKSIGYGDKDSGQFAKAMEVFGVTAGAGLFDRIIFKKLGGFDESFFMYSEEVDFSLRARFSGYKFLYCPKAIVFHKHKTTAKKFPQHVEYWQFRNMYQTIIKDFPTDFLLKKWRLTKIILVYFNTIFYQFKSGYFWPPVMTTLFLLYRFVPLIRQRRSILRKNKFAGRILDSFVLSKPLTFWGVLR